MSPSQVNCMLQAPAIHHVRPNLQAPAIYHIRPNLPCMQMSFTFAAQLLHS